jgi:hypothetical protein
MPSHLSSERSIGIAASAPARHSRSLPVLTVNKRSFSSSCKPSGFFSCSAKVGLLLRGAVQSWHCSTGTAARSVQVRHTRALRADVLRRAISSWGRCAAGLVFRSTGPHVIIRGAGARGISSKQFMSLNARRPNPSIEGTSTSKLRLLAAAPHVKR